MLPLVADQYVTYSAAWFTLSLINAGLAQAKGRSGLAWWLASLLLGPVATLVIVAWPVGRAGGGAATMTTQSALLIAIGIVAAVALFAGLAAVASSTG